MPRFAHSKPGADQLNQASAASLQNPTGPGSRALRIALLGYRSNPFSGGQGVYLKYVSRALAELGHEVHVISGEPYPELHHSVKLIKLPGLNLFAASHPGRSLRARHLKSFTDTFEWASMLSGGFPEPYTFGRRVYRYLRAHAGTYDIVHDNQTLSYGVARLPQLGLPLVTTIHHPITKDLEIALANTTSVGLRLLIRRWHRFLRMQTRVARRLDHIVTVSNRAKADIGSDFGVNPQRIHVVHNGVDCEEFRPMPEVVRAKQKLITTASADQPLKGTQHLIPALKTLIGEFPDLSLTFIGKPKPGGATEQLIKDLGVSGHIEFLHGIDNREIVEHYARATLAVVPSEYEGFGLPAAEAMACGVPVVSTDGGALPEVVGNAGVVVPHSNPTALAGAIATLLREPKRREALGRAGRDRMLNEFSWTAAATTLTSYYHTLLADA